MRHVRGTLAILLGLIPIAAGQVHATNYMYYPGTVLSLGATFEPTDLSRSFPDCIDYSREISLDRSKKGTDHVGSDNLNDTYGAETNFNISQVQSQKDLYRYLNISASISGHYKFFSAGGSFDLEEESRFHEDNFSWIVRATTDYGRFGMERPRLGVGAQEALKRGLSAFRLRCGYEYVAQVNRSVIAAAVYTIRNVSLSEKRKLEASFNASIGGGVWGVSGNTSYKEFIQNAVSQGALELRIYLVGGQGVTKITQTAINSWDVEDVKKKLVAYIEEMGPARAVPTQFVTGSLSAFVPELANLDFNRYTRTIDELYFLRNEYEYRAGRIRSVLLNSEDYGWDENAWQPWKKRYEAIQAKMRTVVDIADQCRQEYSAFQVVATNVNSAKKSPDDRARLELISRGVSQGAAARPESFIARNAFKLSPDKKFLNGGAWSLASGGSGSGGSGGGSAGEEGPSPIYDACNITNVMLDYDDTRLPSPFPFEVDYYVQNNIDASGKEIINLVSYAEGQRVARASFVDAKGRVTSIFDATPQTGGSMKAGGSLDISDFRATDRLPVRLRIEMRSGREYEVSIPFI